MGKKPRNRLAILLFVFSVFFFSPKFARAQYRVFDWFNFEDGDMKSSARLLGANSELACRIVSPQQIAGNVPGDFMNSHARIHLGNYCLRLEAVPAATANKYAVGLASDLILDRGRLGDAGRALFQADFYIPPQENSRPSLAVLAMKPIPADKDLPHTFYRFGMTKQRVLYFSQINMSKLVNENCKRDAQFIKTIPGGSWHRFAIIFEGRNRIHCFVDGKEAPFSPISDGSIQQLQLGVMLAEGDKPYSAYVDNLSIQWSPDNVPLPDSPWIHTWTGAAPALQAHAEASRASRNRLQWLDPISGWNRAAQTRKPLAVYFYAPKVPLCRKLDGVLASDPAAANFLSDYVLAKIDVNQLQGSQFAERFRIYKVPALVVFNNDASVAKRILVSRNDDWNAIEAKLR